MNTREIVCDFFDLYTSERREIANWLDVKRDTPQESDLDFGKRVLMRARDMGKVDELATKIAAIKARR